MRVLEVYNTHIIVAKGYTIFEINFSKNKIQKLAKIHDIKNSIAASIPFINRLFRLEVTKSYHLQDNSRLCIAKKGIFKLTNGERRFRKVMHITRGSRPLNICQDNNKNMYFGEYFSNTENAPVNIYKSNDQGENWNIVYTFPKGSINHIHGIFFDKFTDLLWIVTGDRDNECIIGNSPDGFKTLNIIFQGGQEYRSCILLFYQDFIVFATDSQYIQNSIKCFNRNTKTIKDLQTIQGSAIKGGQYGNVSFISTTVEPSAINKDIYSHLWISKDGLIWKEYFSAKKDWLPSIFQFGSIEFPNYNYLSTRFFFYGRALNKIGGHTVEIEI